MSKLLPLLFYQNKIYSLSETDIHSSPRKARSSTARRLRRGDDLRLVALDGVELQQQAIPNNDNESLFVDWHLCLTIAVWFITMNQLKASVCKPPYAAIERIAGSEWLKELIKIDFMFCKPSLAGVEQPLLLAAPLVTQLDRLNLCFLFLLSFLLLFVMRQIFHL